MLENSKWIWFENKSIIDTYGEFIFDFELEKFNNVTVNLTGDSNCNLYVNGELAYFSICADYLDVKEVEKLFGKFYQALQRERAPVYDFLALSYLMLGMFKRVVSNVQNTVPKTQKQIMLDAVSQYVENNLDQNLSITDIANRFGYERSWLYRTFLNEKGFSLQQYMIMTKIKKARYLVAETEMSYEQIAHTLGYNSYSAFSKVFKKIVGTSPSEYRCNSREYKRGKVVKDSKTGKGSNSKKTVK